MTRKFLFCSNCFRDDGLRKTAEKLGARFSARCPHCHTLDGAKITKNKAETLVTQFFWNGSFFRADFGGASRIVSNPYRYRDSDVQFPHWLSDDATLIQEVLKIGFLHYGPPLWRLGEIEPLKDLDRPATRDAAAKALVREYSGLSIKETFLFHRLRTRMAEGEEANPLQYDSPPEQFLGTGRLDDLGQPVLYGSDNVEICFHECRVTLPEECFIAHLRPRKPLNLLDLRAEIPNDGPTEFESKNLAVHYIFSASEPAYNITRLIAKTAREMGYDGIVYPSYFSLWKPDKLYNFAIFGRPIAEGSLEVTTINRAFLKSAQYDYIFGPLFE
jgi:hypothetical protein